MPIPIEKFASVPLFKGLESDQVAHLLALAEDVRVEPGGVVVQEGDPGTGFYIIAAGAFEVLAHGEGEDKVLARLEELSFFGEMSLVSDAPRSASVICRETGRLKRIPVDGFRRLLQEGDRVAFQVVLNMAGIMAQRLSRLKDRFVG